MILQMVVAIAARDVEHHAREQFSATVVGPGCEFQYLLRDVGI
jgi:hypothetical protein